MSDSPKIRPDHYDHGPARDVHTRVPQGQPAQPAADAGAPGIKGVKGEAPLPDDRPQHEDEELGALLQNPASNQRPR